MTQTAARRLVLLAFAGASALVLLAAGRWVSGSHLPALLGTAKDLSGYAARGYAAQLAEVRLPEGFDVVERQQGGTYFAAGNGPSASVAYRTSASPEAAAAQVRSALEQAGYAVRPVPTDPTGPDRDVLRFAGTAPGRDVEALLSGGVVYDLPYGYVAAVPGTTGVLLVVEDHGRHRG